MSPLKSVQQLWQETYARFMKRWQVYVLFSVLSLLLPFLISIVGGLAFGFFAFAGVLGGFRVAVVIGGLIALAFYVAAFYVSILLWLGLMQMVADDSIIGIQQAVKSVKPKASNAFLTALLLGIILAIATCLLVIPGIYLGVCFAFALWFVLLEGKTNMDALKASKALVDGRWFAVFGRGLAFGVLCWLAVAIPQMIFVALRLAPLAFLWQIVVMLVATPFFTIFSFVLYRNLKETMTVGVTKA